MKMPTQQTQIIKKSIYYRAKYRTSEKRARILPWFVVPHPKNRGGDPMASKRLKQLTGTFAKEGYDPIEANTNGVVVEEKPKSAGGSGHVYQSNFSTKLNGDPEIAEFGVGGLKATFASCGHGHLNCSLRNVAAGKRGCECFELTVVGKTKKMRCACANGPIVDEDGNYSMELLLGHDSEWHQDCLIGIQWEVLSHKMEDEEPDAARIICVALNKRNEAAMKTGHLEIMSTLTSLCIPHPTSGPVAYEPVRDKLLDLYGADVDHPDFVHWFRFILAAGGAGSLHLADLTDFTTVFVNQKLRKIQISVYTIFLHIQ